MSLDHLVCRQAGVVTLRQAVACGVSASTVQRRARQKAWERLHPAVYLVGGHRLTDEVRVRAAWLWAGEGRKRNSLVRAGRDPLRFTWHDLDQRPAAVVEEIRATLRS